MSQTVGIIHLHARDLLMFHILDEINAVVVERDHHDIITFSRTCNEVFTKHGLRCKSSKFSPVNSVIAKRMLSQCLDVLSRRQLLAPRSRKDR